ncbi:hypothetical protein U5B43_08265 [Campylobacter sp. 9BO]|uniref:hypothetical protein n=1 Tax=Campylobacter sp. 9BO TaxID=3424759 RepID=UPI003D35653A
MEENIENIIKEVVLNLQDNVSVLDSKTHFFGRSDAVFDSVGLVSFLIELEEKIYDEFKKNITLSDEKAMSQTVSPFINIKTLSKYIKKCLDE